MADKTLQLALRIVAEATGKQNLEQLVAELRNIEQSADDAAPATDQLGHNLDETAQAAKQTSKQSTELADDLTSSTTASAKLGESLRDVTNKAKTTASNTQALSSDLNQVGTATTNASQKAGVLADVIDELGNQQELIHAFERSKRELEEQEIATAAAAHALDQLQKQAQDTTKPFVELARGIDLAERDLQQMRAELTQQITKHNSLQAELKRSGIDTKDLTVAKRNLAAGFTKAGKSVDGFTQDLKQGSAAQKAHAASLGNVASQIAAVAAAYFGLDQVGQAVRSVFETGDKFEKLQVQMNGLMGSIAQGEKASAWITEFTKNTPLQMGEVSQAFVKLKAFGLDPMDGTLQSITDSALKLGGGFQEVEGISLALGQAWAKQKLQGEEILQLVERGVPVWDMLQDVTGKNVEELQKLSSAGKLGRDVIKQLIDEMGRASAGSAAAQMALFSGQVSNAKDNLEQFYNMIAQSGAMDWLKGQLTELNNEFGAMAADGRLQEWAQSISDTIVATGTAIKDTISTLYEYREEIAFVAKAWLALKVGSYFSNVVAGAVSATQAFTTYSAAVTAATAATNTATIAANRWRSALGFVARGGMYLALTNEVINLVGEYQNLKVAEAGVAESQRNAELQAAKLKGELELISSTTGILVTSLEEVEAAVAAGTLVMNETTGAYENAARKAEALAEATRIAAEEERKRQELLRLTVPEALRVIETLEQQAQNLNGVRAGVDGFIQSIESARTALAGAGEEYNQQLVLLDSLEVKFTAHSESLERQAYLTNDVSKAYKELGITSADALTKTATKLQGAFELIQQSNEPIAMQQQAFLKWANAAIEAASATDQTVPASVQAAAAALGLTAELDKLVNAANKLKPATDINSDAVNRFATALDKTKAAMENNKKILDSSTASAEQKRKAQAALNHQTGLVVEQEADLARVRELETKSLQQLSLEQRKLEQELAQVNQQYQAGALSAEDYQHKKDRVSQILSVVNNLLGDFKNAQDAATNATKRGTRATEDATKANELSLKSLRQQKEELEKVSQSADRAATSMSNYKNRNRPTVEQIVDYQDKYETGRGAAYRFESAEVIAERERRRREKMKQSQYENFERAINSASNTDELSKIYDRIFKQLVYIDGEQKRALRDLINRQRESLKTVASVSRSPTRSNTITPRENVQYYSPSPVPTRPNNSSPLSDAVNGKLDKLLTLLTGQQSGKRIVLELKLPSGNTAELYTTIRDQLLEELEQLSNAQ
ncbi:tape measure protein [Pseudoalteromonas piscicida]|uniref:Phage tail tape measure protein n=1 Tax=Pseudoalteromonas piscicida TaxID=43662 RepID=A0A2A5JJ49_PSEO7|nr:tape measure protein [Pseudoalteromonas piscicida]PCK29492.1 phage tail tape measure protein [Pseudoalteromonas piscicida]